MPFHIIVQDLILQSVSIFANTGIPVLFLNICPSSIFNREWVNEIVRWIRIPFSFLLLSHLYKVQRASNWSVSILKFLVTILPLSSCNLLLPNQLIALLCVLFSLCPHRKYFFVVIKLLIKFSFLDVPLISEFFNLIEKSLFSSRKSGSLCLQIVLNLQ